MLEIFLAVQSFINKYTPLLYEIFYIEFNIIVIYIYHSIRDVHII